jgi:hypothetical protein
VNLQKLNDWLLLLANVGVVIGLVALVAELRHQSQVAQVAAYQTRIAEIQDMFLELAVSETLAGVLVKYDSAGPDALTAEEHTRVRAWYHVILRQMQGQYYQYQKGFLDRAVVDRTLAVIAGGLYDSWEALGLTSNIENDAWRAEIEAKIKGDSRER